MTHTPNSNSFKSKAGIKRIFKAGQYSMQGFRAVFKTEHAFRQELTLSLVLFVLSFFVAHNILQWLILFTSLIIILITELLNSCIETLADLITTEFNPLVGKTKDMGSAAVFLSLALCAVIWLTIIVVNLS
ncbi:diacylglycerol kinase [Brackiella oedipodis]|uniref:diacylglycerol kinase n=1 Tax=Brackiella oedipodis TaxID=124225 RepID=UPI000490F9DD|nr:diacylglycerol kinase [Brackiella oedipodis]